MKKTFIVLGLSLIIAACGNGKSGSGSTADSTATAASHNGTEKAGGTSSAAGAELIAKSDCQTCHKEQEKLVGPAFADIAKKYTSSDAVIDTLADKIIKGGSGNWGTVPMSGHPSISVDDARTMAKYILSVK